MTAARVAAQLSTVPTFLVHWQQVVVSTSRSSDLAELLHCEVDLLDFRAASTVMQYQILTKGQRLYAVDQQVGSYEATLLSAMTTLNEARAGLLADIKKDEAVYGR